MRNYKEHNANPYKANANVEISMEVLINIADLNKTGLRLYSWIRENVYRDEERVYIDVMECYKGLRFKERKSVYEGLNDMLKVGIIAKTTIKGEFYYSNKYFGLEKGTQLYVQRLTIKTNNNDSKWLNGKNMQ